MRKGKIKLEQRDDAIKTLRDKLCTLKQIIDDGSVMNNNQHIGKNSDGICKRLRYSDRDNSIKYLNYTLGKNLHLLATKNSSNLVKQRKVKLLKRRYKR